MHRHLFLSILLITAVTPVQSQDTKQAIVKQYQQLAVSALKSATRTVEEPYWLIGCQIRINMDDSEYFTFTTQQDNALCHRVEEEVGGFRYQFAQKPPYHLADMFVYLGDVKKHRSR